MLEMTNIVAVHWLMHVDLDMRSLMHGYEMISVMQILHVIKCNIYMTQYCTVCSDVESC